MNHEKLIAIGLILTLGLFLTIGCFGPFAEDEAPENGTPENQTDEETKDTDTTPAETVENFVNAMDEGNVEKTREQATESFIQNPDRVGIEEAVEGLEGTIESIEIEDENITNSEAIVEYRITRNDGSEITNAYELIQEDEKWKINNLHNPKMEKKAFNVEKCTIEDNETTLQMRNTGGTDIEDVEVNIQEVGTWEKVGTIDFSKEPLDTGVVAQYTIDEKFDSVTQYEVIGGDLPTVTFRCE